MAKQRTEGPDDAAEEPKGAHMESEKGTAGDAPAKDDVVISVPVHCDGCGRKLRRSLQRLDGVGEVSVDSRSNKVVLSGPGSVENAREAMKIVERKTGKKATLLSPLPDKLPLPAVKGAGLKRNDAGGDIGDEITEVDTEMITVLRINLHCDACCEEIKRRILKIQGVKEAAPLLKSSQMMVKGMIEPATLVGFIHRSTGRRAAIIRAEPLDLLPTTKSPPMDAPLTEAEKKHEDPSVNLGETKDAHDKEMKEEAPQEEENPGGEDENNADEKLGTEKPSDDHGEGHETHHNGEAPTGGSDGFVLENHKKGDPLLTAPLPAGIVTVAPEMALMNKFSYAYPPYPFAHPHHYYQYPPSYPYAYGPAMFGYPQYPPEPFSEENPNACTIV